MLHVICPTKLLTAGGTQLQSFSRSWISESKLTKLVSVRSIRSTIGVTKFADVVKKMAFQIIDPVSVADSVWQSSDYFKMGIIDYIVIMEEGKWTAKFAEAVPVKDRKKMYRAKNSTAQSSFHCRKVDVEKNDMKEVWYPRAHAKFVRQDLVDQVPHVGKCSEYRDMLGIVVKQRRQDEFQLGKRMKSRKLQRRGGQKKSRKGSNKSGASSKNGPKNERHDETFS